MNYVPPDQRHANIWYSGYIQFSILQGNWEQVKNTIIPFLTEFIKSHSVYGHTRTMMMNYEFSLFMLSDDTTNNTITLLTKPNEICTLFHEIHFAIKISCTGKNRPILKRSLEEFHFKKLHLVHCEKFIKNIANQLEYNTILTNMSKCKCYHYHHMLSK